MGALENLLHCPICSENKFKHFISCEDYTVSHETFQIVQCERCGFKFTNPRATEESINKYYQSSDYISHSNTSKGIINSLYQIARRFTISKKVNLVKSICPEGKAILDYGCGTGEFLNSMKKAGWVSAGIEPGNKARDYATANYSLEVYDSSEINRFREKSFDIITLWHVLEHIHKLNETLEILKKLLTPNGKLIIAVPNSEAADSKIYKNQWAAYDVPRHLYHFNAQSVSQLFQNHQMGIKKIFPMSLDAFYVSMLSEKYKKNQFGLLKGILNGSKTYFKSLFNKQNSSSLIFIVDKN